VYLRLIYFNVGLRANHIIYHILG